MERWFFLTNTHRGEDRDFSKVMIQRVGMEVLLELGLKKVDMVSFLNSKELLFIALKNMKMDGVLFFIFFTLNLQEHPTHKSL